MNKYKLIDKVVAEIAKEKGISEGEVGTYDTLLRVADIAVKNCSIPDVVEQSKAYNYVPPFRVGRKQNRAVLDANGHEVVVFKEKDEALAAEFCIFLNSSEKNNVMTETAVEWFFNEIKDKIKGDEDLLEDIIFTFSIAKQKEKNQHSNTWDAAIKAHDDRGHVFSRSTCDFDYYVIS